MGEREASPLFFIKRGFHITVFLRTSLRHLAGLGGDEVGKSGLSVGWCCARPRLDLLEIRLSTALPPHRCLAADAIQGQMDGHAV
jgi:hypothetical protein